MLTTAGQFHNELIKLIDEEYQERRDNLSGGVANDYAEYMKWVGFIQGLRTALELAEINKQT